MTVVGKVRNSIRNIDHLVESKRNKGNRTDAKER